MNASETQDGQKPTTGCTAHPDGPQVWCRDCMKRKGWLRAAYEHHRAVNRAQADREREAS